MTAVTCSACNNDVIPAPPDRRYWALIVAFWAFSLLFGIGAAFGAGWGFTLLVAWVLLATTTGVLVQHAVAWTCPECSATVTPLELEVEATAALPPHLPVHP